MNKNLKEKILNLRNIENKTIKEIKQILNCSYSTIAYHLYPKSKKSTRKRHKESIKDGRKRKYSKSYLEKDKNKLRQKYFQFHRVGHRNNKTSLNPKFTFNELIKYIGENPVCYLTGKKINLNNSLEYSLDHKIPSSRNGDFILNNLGICKSDVNKAKSDKTPEEFLELCKEVLIYNGYKIEKIGGGDGIR